MPLGAVRILLYDVFDSKRAIFAVFAVKPFGTFCNWSFDE